MLMRISHQIAPVKVLLALLLILPASAIAQSLCNDDGIQVVFRNEQAGVVTLRDARTREITGSRNSNRSESVSTAGVQSTNFAAGKIRVDTLDSSAFPDNGIPLATIDRASNNAWEINFARGEFVFDDRSDLDVEVTIAVAGGEASHLFGGSNSTVSLAAEEGNLKTRWYNGTNSLRRLRGNVNFHFSNLQQLGFAGVHRATIDICVNIGGTL
jgi:hypothetical protein